MCEPATIMSVVMAGVSAAQAGQQISVQNSLAQAQAQSAQEAAASDYSQLSLKAKQVGIQGSLKNIARTKQALRERARLRVAMGQAGVSGNSPLREIVNSIEDESFDKGINSINTTNLINQNRMDANSISINARNRINQAEANTVNPYQAILQISSAAMSGYMSGQSYGEMFKGGSMSPITPLDNIDTSISPQSSYEWRI